jgi:hypothetical protein
VLRRIVIDWLVIADRRVYCQRAAPTRERR